MVNSMNQGSGARGSHQLVSEQSDPALDPAWNDDGEWRSSGQGSQHGPPADRLVSVREMRLQAFEVFRRRSSSYDGSGGGSPEGRIAAIETTMGIWSGTILDLSRKVDRVLDLPDRFDRMEKLLEELVNSKKNAENVIPNPPLPFNVPTLESNHHVPGNGSQNWGSNSPMINSAMSTNEQTPEERIRLLRAIAQKYRVPKESSSFDYPPTVVHMKEVDARPIRAMKFYDSLVVGVAVQSKVISDLPKLVGNLKSLAKSNPSGGVDTVKHEVGNQSSDIDAAVQKVVSHDVASSELSLSDLLSLQEVNMSVGSLALFAGGMVHKSDSLVVYTIEEFGGPNIAVVGELREKIPAISAVQIFFYIYKLTNSSFSINDNSSQSFIFSDSSSQASVMIWDPGKVQASSSGRPLSKSVIEINSEAEALVRARQDMREAMGKLGLSFLKLGNFEIKEAIYDSQRTRAADFKRLATDVDRASRSYRELNAQSVKHLDILHQYLGMMLDVHSAFSNRPSTLLTVQTLISDLSSLHTRDEGLEAASSKMEVEKDSMFFQFLHSSKELAKETANFTFQVFIMNHNGQMVPKFSFQAKVWDSGI